MISKQLIPCFLAADPMLLTCFIMLGLSRPAERDGARNTAGGGTYLIGSVDLTGSPGGVFHIVLLHLGADFWAGCKMTGRLNPGEGEGGNKKSMRERAYI